MSKLILITGLPGAGKSTKAKELLEAGEADIFFEADMWMVDEEGNYKFDPNRLKFCHEMCFASAKFALEQGQTVIVSNTFTTKKEARNYIECAKELGADIEIIHLDTQFKSIHGVPEATLDKMRARREKFAVEDF